MPQVGKHDTHARIEERELAQPVLQRRISNSIMVNVRGLGRNVTSVPRRSWAGPTTESGADASPSRNSMECSWPSRQIVSLSQVDSAFTTDTPTPCRPPETL
jgi:hypothetical protein